MRMHLVTSDTKLTHKVNEISKDSDFKEGLKEHLNLLKDESPLSQKLDQSRIRLSDSYAEPPICLEIVDQNGYSILGTLGNFSLIIGKAKSKKTFLMSMALAAALKNDILLDRFKATLPEEKRRIILFDTEQSKYHVQKVVKRICLLSETLQPDTFDCFGLRPFPTEERLRMIKHALDTIPDIGIIVIDGIRDLVKDINSSDEASQIVNLLMKWSDEKNIHIVVVLHQNKGDNNARGHLGTELVNKAESVISVTKDTKDPFVSIVEPEYCREKDFPPFAFKIDPNGMPYVLNDWISADKNGKSSLNAYDYPSELHKKFLKDIFSGTKEMNYTEFWREIKNQFAQHSISAGENKAKEWVKYYEKQHMVEFRQEGKSKIYKSAIQ